ncbi:hypothetical protein HanRHA438_Chr16g0784861 [Helianthus annuus]|nr:hypothetical protein HanRHA438_Chr16g0784861 [Helianthus annuus]
MSLKVLSQHQNITSLEIHDKLNFCMNFVPTLFNGHKFNENGKQLVMKVLS